MLTVSETNRFLSIPKRVVSPMSWREKLSKKEPQWWEFVSAIEAGGVVVEEALFIVQWRPAKGASQDKYNCATLYRGQRIHAIDFDPDGQHTNKAGKGRPWFGKRIGPGTHEHSWSDDGEGYAEPVEPDFGSLAGLFDMYCQRANLSVSGGYVAPPSVQLDLL